MGLLLLLLLLLLPEPELELELELTMEIEERVGYGEAGGVKLNIPKPSRAPWSPVPSLTPKPVREGPICSSRAENGEQQRLPLRLLLSVVGTGLDRAWDPPPRSSFDSESMRAFSKQKGWDSWEGEANVLPVMVMPPVPWLLPNGAAGEKGLGKLLPLMEMTAFPVADGGEKGLGRKDRFLRGME